MTHYGPKEGERFSCGVLAVRILRTGDVLVGAGDGTVAIIKRVKGDNYKKSPYVETLSIRVFYRLDFGQFLGEVCSFPPAIGW